MRRGMPLPFTRSTVPGCVPGGMRSLPLPSSVGISSSPPSAACANEMGSAQTMSSPTRRKNSCGCTRMVSSRSPGGRSARDGVAAALDDARRAVLDAGGDGDLDGARLGRRGPRRGRSCTGRRRCGRCRGSASRGARWRSGRRPAGSGRGRGRCTRAHRSGVEPGRRAAAAAVGARLDALVGDVLRAAERRLLEGDLHLLLERAAVADLDAERAEQVAEDAVDVEIAHVERHAAERAAAARRRRRRRRPAPKRSNAARFCGSLRIW